MQEVLDLFIVGRHLIPTDFLIYYLNGQSVAGFLLHVQLKWTKSTFRYAAADVE